MVNKKNIYSIIAGIMLLLAIPSLWPYGYYQLLRLIVTGVAIYNGFIFKQEKKTTWLVLMIVIGILFNPIYPIYLIKDTWVILDIITAIILFIVSKDLKK